MKFSGFRTPESGQEIRLKGFDLRFARDTIGALIVRIGFWGPSYYKYNKEPPKILLVIIWAPILLYKTLD